MAFPNTERSGKVAHVRYRGGVQGRPPEDVCWEEPTTIRMGVGEVIRGIDEALYEMELIGHDFFLFVNKETGRPSVVYHRHGWSYGVFEIDTPENIKNK